ncbi:phage tail assembly chaperone [Desulfovibrio mangrovi]|uniref:tail fiber assembly protein n=1 Tax=Desulfovibrio mangrovi TaxID=2976983 RepID=UPI0022486378|nr:tail fiber assembly protein [Desulfovibrio mangrovi]UZP67703.1 phage tail assembly chaperone [Desulfovibrio mangrovi]
MVSPSPSPDAIAQADGTWGADPAAVRAERDSLLAACDFTQLTDAPLSAEAKAAWAAYRQALRDITLQAGFPNNVEWPARPDAVEA